MPSPAPWLTTALFFKGSGDHRDLPSFPTRRSSDLTARVVGKPSTDVAYSSDHWLQAWAAANWIVPLEDYFPQIKPYKPDFAPYAIEGMTYKGKLYGLPYYAATIIFIYNEDMLKKAGFS